MHADSVQLKNFNANYTDLFTQPKVSSENLKVCVVIPARDEARNIVKTLDALRLQTDDLGAPLNSHWYEVLLLVNNCTDNTFEIAQKYQQKYPDFPLYPAKVQLPPLKANIGFVRRLLMDEAYTRLCLNADNEGIIASTDGDTQVDGCWIFHIIKEINNGCNAVGGRILTHKNQSLSRLFHLRDVTYRSLLAQAEAILDPEEHDPWPRHYQYFGASMAVTCATYQQVGRLPQVPYLEDDAFHRALQRMDVRIRKTPAVKAYTSTRHSGRVEVGFSEQLKKWSGYDKNGLKQEAEQAQAWLIKFKNKNRLRQCWKSYLQTGYYNQELLQLLAKDFYLDTNWLHQEITTSLYFGGLWETVRKQIGEGKWGKSWELVPIADAITELRSFVNTAGITLSQTNPA